MGHFLFRAQQVTEFQEKAPLKFIKEAFGNQADNQFPSTGGSGQPYGACCG
jgi:hypothetical protein